MRVGVFFRIGNPPPWEHDWHRTYLEALEQAEHAEALGFDAIATTEHHFSPDGYIPSPLTVEAAMAARTRRVAICSFVLLLPLHHPVRLAEDAALVDNISGGRLVLGMGLGFRWEEYAGFGVPRGRSGEVMDEALEILVRCFVDDEVSFHGRHFHVEGVDLRPRSYRRPRPLMWVGRADNLRSVDRVARHALDGFAGIPPPDAYAHYVAQCAELGRPPTAEGQYLLFGHCAADADQAWEDARPYAHWAWAWYRDWHWAYGNTTVMDDPLRDDRAQFVFADPAGWIDALAPFASRRHPTVSHVFVGFALPGMPHAMVMESMELFAREVLPHVRG